MIIKKRIKHLIIFLLFLFVISYGTYLNYLKKGIFFILFNSDVKILIDYFDQFSFFAPFIIFLFVVFEVLLAPVPGMILYVAAGTILGGFFGGIVSFFGNIVGSLGCYYIAKKSRYFFFKKDGTKALEIFDKYNEKYGPFALFFLRLNPFTSSDIFSYLAGFFKMKVKHFFIVTSLGLMPLIFLSSYFGHYFIQNYPIFYKIFLFFSMLYLVIAIYLLYFVRVIEKIEIKDKKIVKNFKKRIKETTVNGIEKLKKRSKNKKRKTI